VRTGRPIFTRQFETVVVQPITCYEGPEGESSYESTLSLISALDGGCGVDPLYGELGGPQGRSGRVRKISPPPGIDPRTVQPVASRYID
jgi:hypothetical protein